MTSYYVDPLTGADTNDGLTELTPWQSLARFYTAKLVPGDSGLFCAKRVFTEPLRLSNVYGTAEQPITYGSYGAGEPPMFPLIYLRPATWIVMRDLRASRGAQDSGVNLSNVQDARLINMEADHSYGNGLEINSSAGISVEGGRFHDNGHKRGTNKIGHGILIGSGATGVTVASARCYGNMEDGVQFHGGAGADNALRRCLMYDNKEDGIDIKGGANTIEGCCLWNNSQRGIGLHQNCTETTLTGNDIACYRMGLTVEDAASVTSQRNRYTSAIKNAVYLLATAGLCTFADDIMSVGDPTQNPHVLNKSAFTPVVGNVTLTTAWVSTTALTAAEVEERAEAEDGDGDDECESEPEPEESEERGEDEQRD